MQAATVEGDTVKLSVTDLLAAEDDSVNLVEGELDVDHEVFASEATVTNSDVDVEDGSIILTADALESGSVSLEMQTESTEDDVTTVTTQTVNFELTGYTGRTTDAIDNAGDTTNGTVTIVPAEETSLPNDAYATLTEVEVPEGIEVASAPEEGTHEAAVAYDISIHNEKQDELSQTGEVAVVVMPENLNVFAELPEGATPENVHFELIHIHADGTAEPVENVDFKHDADGNVTSFSFTTNGFSTYVVRYTVDFSYTDGEGAEHTWSFPGTGSHSLMEVLDALDIQGEAITAADLVLTELVGEAGEKDLYLTQDEETGEYFINSDAAFDDTYTLTMTVDETEYTIIVTDDVFWQVTINLYDYSGNNLISGAALDALKNRVFGIQEEITYSNGGNSNRFTGVQFNSASEVTSFKDMNVPNSGDTVTFKILDDVNNVFTLQQWKDSPDQNNVNNAHLSELQGFALKETDGYVIDASQNKVTLNFQQVLSYTEKYGVRVYVQEAGLEIDEADDYYVFVKVPAPTQDNSDRYFFGASRLIIGPDQTTVDIPITEWFDNNGTAVSNMQISADMNAQVSVLKKKSNKTIQSVADLREPNNVDTIVEGYSISCYNLHYNSPTDEMLSSVDDTNMIRYWYNSLTFATPTGTISKAYIDSFMKDATDFGYYTEEYKNHTADIEATIGAAVMSAVITDGPAGTGEADFGYSGRNLKVNVLKVLKVYTDQDGKPIQNKDVTIRLKDKAGNTVAEKQGNTGTNGRFQVEFDGLEPGDYSVSEVIDDQEITQSGAAQVGGLYVDFSATEAHFLNNTNLNYFGQVAYDNPSTLAEVLNKGTRVPLVILTDEPEEVNTAVTAGNVSDVTVYQNGTGGYKKYDIVNDMKRLRVLSKELIGATDSTTVRVLNYKASDISDEGIDLEDDGRYVVINVMMDQENFCPLVKFDGVGLDAQFESHGKEYATKVLFNLLNDDGTKGYCEDGSPQEFNTSKTGAGIILAPWANAHYLTGDFGGTIISKEVNRNGGELHSYNPNQRQTLNITIQNIVGEPNVGMLELIKAFASDSIKDKITYFTFKVTLSDTNEPSKVQGQSFPASGLKEGNEVTFDESGVAFVEVRADNTVTIANLPEGTTYAVEEITTPATAHYVHVNSAVNGTIVAGETANGAIVKGTTQKVTVTNDLRKTGLTLRKTVNNAPANDGTQFHFDLYLWSETEDESTHETTYTAFTETSGLTVTGTTASIILSSGSYDDEHGEHVAGVWSGFTLTNGQEINISGLPQGLNYAFVENTTGMPAGYGVVTPDGEAVGALDANGSVATIVNEYIDNTSVEVRKVWSDGNPSNLNAEMYLLRFKKTGGTAQPDPVPETPTTGSLRIVQTLTGAGADSSTFTGSYVVKKDDVEVRSGSYSSTNGATISGLEPGNYTVEVTGSDTTYDVTTALSTAMVTVTANQTADAYVSHELTTPVTVPTTGSIVIAQTLTGAGASSSTFTGSYTVRKDGNPVSSGSYNNKAGATFSGLVPGNYTVEVTGSDTTYDVQNATQTASVNVTAGNTATVNVSHELRERQSSNAGNNTATVNIVGVNWRYGNIGYDCGPAPELENGSIVLSVRSSWSNPLGSVTINASTNWRGSITVDSTNLSANGEQFGGVGVSCSSEMTGVLVSPDSFNGSNELNVTITAFYSQPSASALSPFQMAFNPFVAYADEGTPGALPAGIASGINIPEGYELDSEGWRYVKLTPGHLSETLTDLPKVDADGNDYYYMLVEYNVPSNYNVSYSQPSPVPGSQLGGTIATLTATNTPIVPKGTITIRKVLDSDTTRYDALKTWDYWFGIYRDQEANDLVETLHCQAYSADNYSNTVTSNPLPYGTYWVYELTDEVEVNGVKTRYPIKDGQVTKSNIHFTVTTSSPSVTINASNTSGTVEYTNKVVTDYVVQKRWMRSNGTWDDDYGAGADDVKTIYFKLKRTVNGSETYFDKDGKQATGSDQPVIPLTYAMAETAWKTETDAGVTVTKGETVLHWIKEFTNLPGNHSEYSVVECDKDGNNYPDGRYTTCTVLGDVTALKNSLVEVKGEKVWKINGDRSAVAVGTRFDDYYITLQLKRGETVLDTQTVGKANNNWSYTWNDLAEYDPETGAAYSYSVVETGVYASQADAEAGTNNLIGRFVHSEGVPVENGALYTTTITNDLSEVDIDLVKVDSVDHTRKLSNAKFQLMRRELGSTDDDFARFENNQFEEIKVGNEMKKMGPVTITSTDGLTIQDLLPGEYQVQEIQAPPGYILTDSVFTFTINADGTVTYENGNELVTFENATFTIGNNAGVQLPSTGGMGTGMFTAAGVALLLLALAGCLLKARKRDTDA